MCPHPAPAQPDSVFAQALPPLLRHSGTQSRYPSARQWRGLAILANRAFCTTGQTILLKTEGAFKTMALHFVPGFPKIVNIAVRMCMSVYTTSDMLYDNILIRLDIYIYIYIYICVCVCVCMYIYIYINMWKEICMTDIYIYIYVDILAMTY